MNSAILQKNEETFKGMNTEENQAIEVNFRKDVTKLKIVENEEAVPADSKENMVEFTLEIE